MVVVVLLLLIEDLQLQEELLLLEELCIGRVHLGWTLFVCLLVGRDVLVVFQLLDLQPGGEQRLESRQYFHPALPWSTQVNTF